MDRRFCAAAARTRLDRGSHRRDRVSLGGGTPRALTPRSPPSSSGSRSMSSSRTEPRTSSRQSRRHRSSRSCSRRQGTRSATASSRAWRDRAATSPACRASGPILLASGSNFCARSVPGLRRLAIMANVGNPAAVLEMGEVQAAAGTLGLEVATARNPASGGYRARLRGAQGSRGRTLCL